MPKKKNTSPLTGRNLRIRFIHQFVLEEKGNQSDMLEFVNQNMRLRGQLEIGRATLEGDLAFLNRGDFHDKKPNLQKESNGLLYWARLDRRTNTYRYQGKNIPELYFMTDEEQMTLPFLKGLFSQYGHIPAIKKLLDEAQVFFNVQLDQVSDEFSFVVQDPSFKDKSRAAQMISNAIQLLGHINRSEVISLSYRNITNSTSNIDQAKKYRFCPLLIRQYQQLFYISGILTTTEGEKFVNLRIDLIVYGSIHPIPMHLSMRFETFHRHQLWSSYHVDEKLKKAIGVWIHDDHAIEETITIRFYDWAVSQMLTFIWHPSQRILNVNDVLKTVDVSFTFYTSDAETQKSSASANELAGNRITSRPIIPELLRYPEAGYLLGRFVNFMEFL